MNMPLRAPAGWRSRPFTRDEYLKLYELGFFYSQLVELIGVEIVEMSPQSNWHAAGIALMEEALKRAFDPNQYWVRNQASLDLSPISVPDPDLAVVTGSMPSWAPRRDNPTTAVLVVEVSETTLWEDRTRKASLYAAAGTADYWILDLQGGRLEVRRGPQSDPNQEFGFGFASLTTLNRGDVASPLAAPAARIPVDDVLPN